MLELRLDVVGGDREVPVAVRRQRLERHPPGHPRNRLRVLEQLQPRACRVQHHQAAYSVWQVERELALEPERGGVEPGSFVEGRQRQADVVDHRLTTSRRAASTAVPPVPLRGRGRPLSQKPRSFSPSLTIGGGGLAAMPFGCLMAVSVRARPATTSWYLPTPNHLSMALTNRPVLV